MQYTVQTVADQMVIKVKQPFIQTYDRVEVFVNNDGLREYRIPLILENQSNNLLPQQMTEIVRWLMRQLKRSGFSTIDLLCVRRVSPCVQR